MTILPPETYLDGCTLFPNSFGRVSHRAVCHQHDLDYWNDRTFVKKVKADFRWAYRLNKVHWKYNSKAWAITVTLISPFALTGLLIGGSIMWNYRHRFDKEER